MSSLKQYNNLMILYLCGVQEIIIVTSYQRNTETEDAGVKEYSIIHLHKILNWTPCQD